MPWGQSAWGQSAWGAAQDVATYLDTPTTTVELVRDGMISAVHGLTPELLADTRFRVNRAVFDFEDWCENHANACFRRFQIKDLGGYEPPQISDHIIESLESELQVLVAYPMALITKFGAEGERDMYDLVRSDMHLIDGAIGHRGGAKGNYVSGQHGTVINEKTFREGDGVLFLEMFARSYFYRTAT